MQNGSCMCKSVCVFVLLPLFFYLLLLVPCAMIVGTRAWANGNAAISFLSFFVRII